MSEYKIPKIITEFSHGSFEQFFVNYSSITKITYNNSHWKFVGDRIFNNEQHFCSFVIPKSVRSLNGKIYF